MLKKYNPLSEFSNRLNYLKNNVTLYYGEIINFNYLDLKSQLYESCLKGYIKKEFELIYVKESHNLLTYLNENLDEIISKVKKPYPIDHPLFNFNVLGGENINNDEKNYVTNFLSEEIKTYLILVEVIIDATILLKLNNNSQKKSTETLIPSKSKSGRKPIITNFKGDKKLTEEQITMLFDFILSKRTKEELFEQFNSSREDFIEIMRQDNVSDIASRNYKIKLGVENYMFAFILTWLEKNSFLKSAFKAVENSASFYSSNNSLLTQNNLAKGKGSKDIEKYITTTKPSSEPIINNTQDEKQYFSYLNFVLHVSFH